MQKSFTRQLRPVILLFVILTIFFIAGKSILEKGNIDPFVVIIGNLILFVATILSFWMGWRGMNTTNPNAIVRSVYASFMIKFFVCLVAAFIYILMVKKNVNRPGLAGCMIFYIAYTYLEVSILMKLSKQKKNA